MPDRPTVLLIDDHAESRRSLAEVLHSQSYAVMQATASQAVAHLSEGRVQAVIAAVGTGGPGRLQLLERLQREQPGLPVIVLTSEPSMDLAVQAMKRGARYVLAKPVPISRLLAELREAMRGVEPRGGVALPADVARREMRKLNIIGHSRAMLELFDTIKRIAPRAGRVLVTGESGTGKELVARALHDLGARSRGPFIAINCATLSDQILESELFGHERGAFTSADQQTAGVMEAAHGGTLFLDEINEMGTACQAKVLRALERKEFRRVGGTRKVRVDFNLIAATNVDLARSVAERRFRADLYYRLKVVTLEVPPLRSRREAIPVLAAHFLVDIGRELKVEPKSLTAAALAALESHSWPGNVRELHNLIEELTLTVRRSVIDVRDLPAEIRAARPTAVPPAHTVRLDEAERELIRRALQTCPTIRDAARAIGIGERTIYTKIKQYRLTRKDRTP